MYPPVPLLGGRSSTSFCVDISLMVQVLEEGFFAANRLAIGAMTKLLFVANEQTINVSVFSIDPATGALTLVPGAPFPTGGVSNAGISLGVTPDNQFLFASSAGSNNITVFSIAANGTLTSISGSPFSVGGIPDGIKVSPDGRFLAVAVRVRLCQTLLSFFVEAKVGGANPRSVRQPHLDFRLNTMAMQDA